MPPGLELQRCCCSNRRVEGAKQREEREGGGGEFVRWHPDRMPGAPKWFLPLGAPVCVCVCPPMGQQFTMLLAAPERAETERAAILLRWPQSPGSSQSIPLSRPLSFCRLLSPPQSASQRTSSGKIEVAIQALTFSRSLVSPPPP